jgi:hypothetical protein
VLLKRSDQFLRSGPQAQRSFSGAIGFMLSTNTNFDTKHALDYKTPIYLIHFDGETVDFCNHAPGSPTYECKNYLKRISGLSQKVEPEEGRASIGGVTIELLDYGDEITALLATDASYFHRKKTTVKAGYLGMDEADMLSIFTGWVTGLNLSGEGLVYVFQVTDPQKWMQRKVFRGATEDLPVTISGNWVNVMLAVLTSTGAGTNGDYDWYDEENGLGLDTSFINVTHIEKVRDDWFPGDSCYVKFTIKDRTKAKDFFETEFFKVFNCYPIIDGQGRFDIKPFRPPLAALESVQTFNEDNIVKLPEWDANLDALINEAEFYFDWDSVDDEFDEEVYYIESDSLNARGPGKKALTIKTKGLHTTGTGSIPDRATDQIVRRKNKVFGRWATPPVSIKFGSFFSRWLSEAGDVVPFSHWLLPDVERGLRGLSETRMEIINRTVDWDKGQVRFELLNTGFAKETYMVLSPVMTVTAGTSGTAFSVSVSDAAKWTEGWEADIFDSKGRLKAQNITILTIDTATGAVTCDNIGATPAAGWMVQFAAYASLTPAQQKYWTVKTAGANLMVP